MGGGGACMGCHVSPPQQKILYETLVVILIGYTYVPMGTCTCTSIQGMGSTRYLYS